MRKNTTARFAAAFAAVVLSLVMFEGVALLAADGQGAAAPAMAAASPGSARG